MYYMRLKENLLCVLGIHQSAKNKVWLERLDQSGINNALAMTQKYGVADLLARVMSARGVDEINTESFINPTLRTLMPNPAHFTDMQQVAARIACSCLQHEQVAIYGDYDVDGACASAILSRFLNAAGADSRIYIPDRILEGYGPNAIAVRRLVAEGASLIITVDCGANSITALSAARTAGASVIVLDHHQMSSDNLLLAADWLQINPNRPDDLSGQEHLCAAGVVFITLTAVSRILREKGRKNIPDLLSYLDLVAFATICDIVPLKGINRAFVVKGLKIAHGMHNTGLTALAMAARIGAPLNTFHLGYILGPRLNAGGRIGHDPSLGAQLLTCDDQAQAAKIAEQLDDLNRMRQVMEAQQLEEAEMQITRKFAKKELFPGIVVVSGNWHPGIIGLIAARLKETLNQPILVIAVKADGMGVGSARSIPGIDIGAIITRAVTEGLLEKGGGHAMAAGFTVRIDKIEELRLWLEEKIDFFKNLQQNQHTLLIDGVVSAGGITAQLITTLERAGPYGAGHDAPIFVVPALKLVDVREVGKEHISIYLKNTIDGTHLRGIAFRALGTQLGNFLFANRMNTIHLAGNLFLNYWKNRITPQIRIIDAANTTECIHPDHKVRRSDFSCLK
ncbi:MAG: single-stranded-DNA-specific exonuclease [Candidatus Tokpelaia sp. JSC085]|nr:MAG: single-stranded-DNA-specific exonuclease [Candidatus Tokpelaia sp. JSC085]